MATVARTLPRTLARSATPVASSLRTNATSNARFFLPQQAFRSSRRGYSSQAGGTKASSAGLFWGLGGLAAVGGLSTYLYKSEDVAGFHWKKGSVGKTPGVFKPTKQDYQNVYNEIARLLVEKDDYDDGRPSPIRSRNERCR